MNDNNVIRDRGEEQGICLECTCTNSSGIVLLVSELRVVIKVT